MVWEGTVHHGKAWPWWLTAVTAGAGANYPHHMVGQEAERWGKKKVEPA